MALDFPSNPTVGQQYAGYIFDGVAWDSTSAQPISLSTTATGYNSIINGGFDISQRGTSISNINSDGTYTADRFYVARGGPVNYTQGTSAPPVGFTYYGSFVNNGASNPFMTVSSTIETRDAVTLAGKVVTISFYARANANTTLSKNFTINGMHSSTVDAKVDAIVSSTNFSAPYGTTSSDWTRFSHTFTVPTTAKTVGFSIQSTGTLAVGDGIHVTGVQLEQGSAVTAFRRNAPSIQGELAACQRYFVRFAPGAQYSGIIMGWQSGTTNAEAQAILPVPLRGTPAVAYNGVTFSDAYSYDRAITGLTIRSGPDSKSISLAVTWTTAAGAQGRPGVIRRDDSTAPVTNGSYVDFSSEL